MHATFSEHTSPAVAVAASLSVLPLGYCSGCFCFSFLADPAGLASFGCPNCSLAVLTLLSLPLCLVVSMVTNNSKGTCGFFQESGLAGSGMNLPLRIPTLLFAFPTPARPALARLARTTLFKQDFLQNPDGERLHIPCCTTLKAERNSWFSVFPQHLQHNVSSIQ